MSIFRNIGEMIKKYGGNAILTQNGKSVNIKAFVQPLRYKNKIYIGTQRHMVGMRKTEKYLYIGLPENDLSENKSIIEANGNKYIVKRCEKYFVNNIAVYMWAILAPYGERLEDDYESD